MTRTLIPSHPKLTAFQRSELRRLSSECGATRCRTEYGKVWDRLPGSRNDKLTALTADGWTDREIAEAVRHSESYYSMSEMIDLLLAGGWNPHRIVCSGIQGGAGHLDMAALVAARLAARV